MIIDRTVKRAMRGGIFLFVVFLLPILIIGIILITEIPLLSLSSNSQQATLDTLVLSAAQQLPDVEAAERSLKANAPFSVDSKNLIVTPESIEATTTSERVPILLSYFGINKGISTTVRSKAVIPPLSVTIALDTNRYTAPTGTNAWNTNAPSAGLFVSHQESGVKSQLNPIRQTQGCFNELSLPLKHIGIETYRSLARVPNYRVSAAVLPAVVDGTNRSEAGHTAVKSVKDPRPQWVEYRGLHHSNSSCAAAALHETLYSTDSPYRFPAGKIGATPGVGPSGERIVNLDNLTFNYPEYTNHLSVEEVFWSQATKEYDATSMVDSLISVGSFAIGEDRAIAGTISASRRNTNTVVAIIVAGDLPRSRNGRFPDEAVKSELENAAIKLEELAVQANVTLHIPYILFKNRTGVTIEEGAAFSTFLNSIKAMTPHVRITALMTESADELERTLLPFLRNLRQPVVLSR